MGQGCRRRRAEADCHPPELWGVCWGVSLRLPEVSSGGGCVLLDVLSSGQGWS